MMMLPSNYSGGFRGKRAKDAVAAASLQPDSKIRTSARAYQGKATSHSSLSFAQLSS
jgi:hypothetical protein